MSQAELARSIDASRSWVFQMERGNAGAEIGLVLKALKALGLVLDVDAGEETARGQQADSGPLHRVDLAWILDRTRERLP
jgi:DNA-binding XRE family transcriptional regulator